MNYDPNTPRGRVMKRIIQWLLDELENGMHEVVLIPAPYPRHSGHQIRALQYSNAAWYSKFAAQFVNCRGIGPKRMRRARKFIKRSCCEESLRRMLAGDFRGIY